MTQSIARKERRGSKIHKISRNKIDSTDNSDTKPLRGLSEVFFPFLGCHQEVLLGSLRRRRPFACKGQFEVIDDLIWGQALSKGCLENLAMAYFLFSSFFGELDRKKEAKMKCQCKRLVKMSLRAQRGNLIGKG